jgi:hypothetical protein
MRGHGARGARAMRARFLGHAPRVESAVTDVTLTEHR